MSFIRAMTFSSKPIGRARLIYGPSNESSRTIQIQAAEAILESRFLRGENDHTGQRF
jgi:hypothetical protein